MKTDKKKILVWSTSSLDRARYKILFKALQESGHEIVICRQPVWDDLKNKTKIRPLGDGILLLVKHIFAYFLLIFRYLAAPRHDIVLVPYVSQLDVFFIKPLAFLRRKPVIADIYISIYDTMVNDRKLLQSSGIAAKLIYFFERLSFRIPNKLFIDSEAHARQVEELFRLEDNSIKGVFVGADEQFYHNEKINPEPLIEKMPDIQYLLFYGNLSPLHGVEAIIDAAEILAEKNNPVHFIIIGEGQLSEKINRMIDSGTGANITRIPRVDYSLLPEWISQSDICLGVFAANEKTDKVIPNKVFQVLASGKPLITADTSGLREFLDFTSMDNNVYPVPPENAKLLAERILEVVDLLERAPVELKPVIIQPTDIARQFERIFE